MIKAVPIDNNGLNDRDSYNNAKRNNTDIDNIDKENKH